MHPVVVSLAVYNEPTVLGVVPAAILCLYVKPELVAAARCQLMKQVVAKPEVASRVVNPTLYSAHALLKRFDASIFCWTSNGIQLTATEIDNLGWPCSKK